MKITYLPVQQISFLYTKPTYIYIDDLELGAFLQMVSALLDLMPATSQLPCLTWNTSCCLKRKLNQWPQSNYISRPASRPHVCFTPVCVSSVDIVSTTRAFCHLPAGLIRVLQSYEALQRSSTPQEAASTLQTPHSAICSVSSSPRGPLKMVWSLFSLFFSVRVSEWRDSAEVGGHYHSL